MIDKDIRAKLEAVYHEIMWLANRPNVTAANARSWYTHVIAEKLKRHIRHFTGKVSRAAIESTETPLRLEHYKRIQTTLTGLVDRHRSQKLLDPDEFISTVIECEHVHIVTFSENYAASKAKGNYRNAGIDLRPWESIPTKRQDELWSKMLRGKVANSKSYSPQIKKSNR